MAVPLSKEDKKVTQLITGLEEVIFKRTSLVQTRLEGINSTIKGLRDEVKTIIRELNRTIDTLEEEGTALREEQLKVDIERSKQTPRICFDRKQKRFVTRTLGGGEYLGCRKTLEEALELQRQSNEYNSF